MAIQFDPTTPLPDGRWREVKLGDDTFEVLVRRPTWEEQLKEHEIIMFQAAEIGIGDGENMMSRYQWRVRKCITDWRGVTGPDGQPVPFAWDTLARLCCRFQSVGNQISALATNAFFSDEPPDPTAPAKTAGRSGNDSQKMPSDGSAESPQENEAAKPS